MRRALQVPATLTIRAASFSTAVASAEGTPFKLAGQNIEGDQYAFGQHFIHARLGYRGVIVVPYVAPEVKYYPASKLPQPTNDTAVSFARQSPVPLLRPFDEDRLQTGTTTIDSSNWQTEHSADSFSVLCVTPAT
jgi:hypothetical protein